MMKSLLLVCITSLWLGNGFAFSPLSATKGQTPARISRTPSVMVSSKSTNDYENDGYDYDELMNSPVEQNRIKNQLVHYGHNDWLRHRASDRFFRNLLDPKEFFSPVVLSLLDEVAILVGISLVIILWNELVIDGYTDFAGMHHDAIFSASTTILPKVKLSLPMEPFFLCGGPLGLLLVFRSDASFGRYKEALHLWEKIMSTFSNMLLMASNASPSNIKGIRDMGIASWALCRTLQHEVSGNFDPVETYENDIRGTLTNEKQADRLLSSRNKLYRATYDIHQTIEPFTDEITVLDKRTLINSVNDVADCCVQCERIYTSPIPLLYTRHTLKFITFWMTFMPLAFYNLFESSWNHILMIPAIIILSILFFGIEEIAVSLEEPFSMLPLNELVDELYESIDDVTEWMKQEQDVEAKDAEDSSSFAEDFLPEEEMVSQSTTKKRTYSPKLPK